MSEVELVPEASDLSLWPSSSASTDALQTTPPHLSSQPQTTSPTPAMPVRLLAIPHNPPHLTHPPRHTTAYSTTTPRSPPPL